MSAHEATGGHELVRASAGTGKTYHLVQTYVGFLRDARVAPSGIVAITFTRKAAAELRERIRARLGSLDMSAATMADLARAPINNFHGLALQLLQSFGPEHGFGGVASVLAGGGDDERLFREACEQAWFGDTAASHDAVKVLSSAFALDAGFPSALWLALSRAREDGVALEAHRLLRSYDAAALRATLAMRAAAAGVTFAQRATGCRVRASRRSTRFWPRGPTLRWRHTLRPTSGPRHAPRRRGISIGVAAWGN